MITQILSFLLDVAAGLLAGACLLRLYMQYQRMSFGNPVGQFALVLTNWLVLPLRRILPKGRRLDVASLVAAYLVVLVQFALLWLMAGGRGGFGIVPLLAVFGLARLLLMALVGLMIVYVVLSWVNADSPVADVIDRLAAPLLRPLRRVIPLVGGFDLSPLAFLVLVQVGLIVLEHLQAAALF